MGVMIGKKPHVLAVPFPAQGHVKPLMKLARQIAKYGIKVTFANIESVHDKIVSYSAKMSEDVDVDVDEDEDEDEGNLVLTSVGDGRGPDDDHEDVFKLLDTLRSSMPQSLTDLIETINASTPDERISCVIADITMSYVSETAEKMGAEFVVFSPPSAAAVGVINVIPKLLEEGILDQNGSVTNGQTTSLSDDIPAWRKDEFSWSFAIDLKTQKIFFECSRRVLSAAAEAKLLISNTCYELEPAACDLIPNILPVGPLTLFEPDGPKSITSSCNFHREDPSCLTWLDSKPPKSVIYVSFGSLAVFSQQQLDELALGLEMSGRAFLWVVRSDLANGSRAVFPDGFVERVGEVGKIVEWAPQEEVLSHPSVACFLSHCGWNSTLEGLSRGLPFLCWPYFSDQFHNQKYICDKWEIGLRIDPDENGIRLRHEIMEKIDMLFCDDGFKENATRLKEITAESVGEGGSSYENMMKFIDHLRKIR
ncbi:UDP-glycosyltransferase 83A1-like [Salvia miltiorrhiza]|uniref:UDP-glycosyltransferase 83A1-like n=1 Tax=Salvia miltiorrhiza TaxID=226208 RepID=UPI0025ABB915|nr:UDP-glycosyltransferase 83A1-like [Salvia miltiorrhiza]